MAVAVTTATAIVLHVMLRFVAKLNDNNMLCSESPQFIWLGFAFFSRTYYANKNH